MDNANQPFDVDQPLGATERAELEALRRENAELRGRQMEAAGRAPQGGRPGRRAWRWTASVILLVLTAVLALASVTANYLRSELLDTDHYVATVAPLAKNPTIQAEITDQVTRQITSRVNIEGITRQALTAITQSTPRVAPLVTGLAPVIADQATSLIHDTVSRLVMTDQFNDLWIQANRRAHQAMVAVATGETSGAVSVNPSGAVQISTAAIIDRVKQALVQRGVGFAAQIPSTDAQITIFQSPDLIRVQRAVGALEKLAAVLPWLTLACAAGAVFAAPPGSRRRALMFAGLSLSIAMILLALGLLIARSYYLGQIPPDAVSPGAAQTLIDALLVPLRTALRMVFVLGLVVALAAFLSGPSSAARMVRRGFTRGADYVTGKVSPGPARPWQRWLARYRRILEGVIVGIAALLLVFWQYPSAAVVISIAASAVVLLVVVELLARPGVVERQLTSEGIPVEPGPGAGP
ncbi:hypothetical protein LVY72_18410 [Arthrobacter sp. I2-34]|uniref:Integral membrane protein n=1 Tax=Arthrobacter hankyongi TaxID=2904801 RepID=A0ABS9LB92_9MICC|nr:hypothetical protein [Arthrobacter hankyongi]MCG2623871.1 hypothetical protein [Arthrobacter hankyongi]